MGELGFVLAQLDPFYWQHEDPVSAVEIDGDFRRRGPLDELGQYSEWHPNRATSVLNR